MFRIIVRSMVILAGITLITACGPKQITPSPELNIANPASVYCTQNGGSLEFRPDAGGGATGVCHFPDGSECEEWAFFRDECKPGDSSKSAESSATTDTAFQIVYFKDGHLMVWDEAQGLRALTETSTEQVRISDDGQVAVFLGSHSSAGYGLYSIHTDGTALRLLAGQNFLQSSQTTSRIAAFDFAPASHTIFFVTDQYDLQRVDADNGSPIKVFERGEGGFFSFSPDGQWMTLYHPNELILSHPDGSSAHTAFQYPPEFSYTMIGPEVIWKADSSGFSIASASGPQFEAGSMSVWFIPVQGEPVLKMSYAGPHGANLSPDGQSLVYMGFQHEPVDVHIITADGQDILYASYSTNVYPAVKFLGWTPDSKTFLLNLSEEGRLSTPYLCSVGNEPVKLTDTTHAETITWVDAERLLFISEGSLRLEQIGKPSMAIDRVSGAGFDFTLLKS